MEDYRDDITRNLSSDPKECEKQLRYRIIDLYQRFQEIEEDTTTWECNTLFNLLNLLGKNEKTLDQAVWNALLLFLALFPAQEELFDKFDKSRKNLRIQNDGKKNINN